MGSGWGPSRPAGGRHAHTELHVRLRGQCRGPEELITAVWHGEPGVSTERQRREV